MRFSGASALAVAVGTIALVIPSGAAVAAGGTDCPPGGGGGSYPGSSCTLQISDSRVVRGEDVQVSGSGFASDSPYTVTFHSTPQSLPGGTADSNGTVTTTVTIPDSAHFGRHTIIVDGVDAQGGARELTARVVVVPRRAGGSVQGASASGSGGGAGSVAGTSATAGAGMPNTGADQNLLPLLGAGGGLVIVGVGIVAASRRRRYSAHQS